MCLLSEGVHDVGSKLSTSSQNFRRVLLSHAFIVLAVLVFNGVAYFVGDCKPGGPCF